MSSLSLVPDGATQIRGPWLARALGRVVLQASITI